MWARMLRTRAVIATGALQKIRAPFFPRARRPPSAVFSARAPIFALDTRGLPADIPAP